MQQLRVHVLHCIRSINTFKVNVMGVEEITLSPLKASIVTDCFGSIRGRRS
jgi:hypothetical protein